MSTSTDSQVSYPTLKTSLKTGDIIMFAGFDVTGYEIMALETMENIDPFTHCGIVVELPTSDGATDLYFWHAIPPDAINEFGPDYYKNAQCDGCVVVSLDSVMKWAIEQDQSGVEPLALIVREVSDSQGNRGITDPDALSKFMAFTKVMCGRSFSAPVAEGMILDYYQGYQEASGTHGYKFPPNGTFFCSKLASATYQAAGLLPASLVTNSVLPGHFGSDGDGGKLQWQNGYSFSDNIYFTAK